MKTGMGLAVKLQVLFVFIASKHSVEQVKSCMLCAASYVYLYEAVCKK